MTGDIPRAASPDLADRLAEPVVELHAGWEETTLRFVAQRLGRDIAAPDWAQRRAVDLTQVRRDLDRTLAQLRAAAGPEIDRAIAEAYRRGHGSPAAPARLRQLTERTVSPLRALWDALRRSVLRAWHRAVAVGGRAQPDTRRVLVQREVDRLATRGITAFRDVHGRALAVVPYVDQAVQTAAGHAAMDGYLDRLTEHGEDLVRVTESAHPCPICVPWEGRVLSVSGMSGRYPSLDTARAAGLWHPRCHHTIERYVPGAARHPHATRHRPGTYEQVQRQRAIERHIRAWKRRQAAALDADAARAASRKVRYWQAQLRAHIAAHGLQRSRQRERTDFGHSRPLTHALGGRNG